MFRLTREVRFAINATPDAQLENRPTNSYAGYPSLTGVGHFFAVQVTLRGSLQEKSSYLRNIKEIDALVRQLGVPLVEALVRFHRVTDGAHIVRPLFEKLRDAWPATCLDGIRFALSPYLAYSILESEYPMVRLSQKFEFSATHRLHNPSLSEEENQKTFGKCNNPHGHGHNYEVQVTIACQASDHGSTFNIPAFERLVGTKVIDRFDHKNLNFEVPEFQEIIPSVENIAMVIYRLLKPEFKSGSASLAAVTVWETPKTWCEYSE